MTFCSREHAELARHRHIEQISRRLADTDVTQNLPRSEMICQLQPLPPAGDALRIRNESEFARGTALILPKFIELDGANKLAGSFGAECVLSPAEPAPGTRTGAIRWMAKSEPKLSFWQLPIPGPAPSESPLPQTVAIRGRRVVAGPFAASLPAREVA